MRSVLISSSLIRVLLSFEHKLFRGSEETRTTRNEIHFQGDPKKNDPMYRSENAIAVEDHTVNGKVFQTGVFDVVLERERS